MAETNFIQFFVKLFDNKTLTLQFPIHQTLTPQSIKHQIESLTKIPTDSQNLTLNGRFLSNSTPISPKSLSLSTIYLNFSLLGGKGGFGSLLRGAATKAGQKKTNNFDACRDMSGRRLRHVNAEKRLEEWKAEEEERKLEKMADDYLKKMVKKGKGGKKEQGAEKYVEKYREDSKRCVEEVARSVKESMGELMSAGNKKRKLLEKLKDADAKKAKIWMGKRKVGESDSDYSDDDAKSDDGDAENEKSVVTENGNQSDSSKDASSASVSALPSDGDNHNGGSSESGSEEEKDMIAEGTTEFAAKPSGCNEQMNGSGTEETSSGEKMSASEEVVSTSAKTVVEQDPVEPQLGSTTVTDQLPGTSTLIEPDGLELNVASECKGVSSDEGNSGGLNAVEAPLNLDDFNSAAEMEVLGLERLKSELLTRGLKCGGTLQERAARLFLLKTTPLEKIPKKLLAKK
ncbi:protein SDE2 homolog [Chenopodium quinoa]|uniref:Ubiquitin-like domain-containing protein n=1 Tax=Chenopodium quinoa TaxID=63459 RepID=A0A803KZM5_CHEQI|nr:protein SDE2 homolog [Chenopodium quinoa]